MRFLALPILALLTLLGAAAFAAPGAVAAPSDPAPVVAAAGPSAPEPAVDEEARAYAERERGAPEVAGFVGGHATLFGVLVFVALVLFIVWLVREI